MADLKLVRGDRRELAIGDLVDAAGAPAAFASNDLLRWTAKRSRGQPDSLAIIRKSSANPGEIVFSAGSGAGSVFIEGSDWVTLPRLAKDLVFYWDLQLAVGGDLEQIVTLTRGKGLIEADTTLADP